MAIGKSLRFEVFARDGFTCQYCGTRPPDVVLEVDHIHPRAKGGSDDIINLVTSCFDCNRGKRDKVISDVAPRPDADIPQLAIQQEIAEARRFMQSKAEREQVLGEVAESLRDTWRQYLIDTAPADRVIVPWINRYGPEEIEQSIIIASAAYNRGRFGWREESAFNKLLPFIGAVLRNRAQDREAGAAV